MQRARRPDDPAGCVEARVAAAQLSDQALDVGERHRLSERHQDVVATLSAAAHQDSREAGTGEQIRGSAGVVLGLTWTDAPSIEVQCQGPAACGPRDEHAEARRRGRGPRSQLAAVTGIELELLVRPASHRPGERLDQQRAPAACRYHGRPGL
jgi:hypothetical protein